MERVRLKIVTFNIQFDTAENTAPRFALAKKRIDDEKPDLIGFQEVRDCQRELLEREMPEYALVGYGRDDDYTGEQCCIAYRRDTFRLLEFRQCWLSPTQYVAGSRYDGQSRCPRILTEVVLKHKDREEPIRYYNTHLEHIVEPVRVLQMRQILSTIAADYAAWPLPVILTGDMNSMPEDEPIRCVAEEAPIPLKDYSTAVRQSFHGYDGCENCKLDYIFADAGREHGDAYIWDDSADCMTISDHYPVACDIIL